MRKKAFVIGFLLLLLIAIPVTVFLVQRQQELRSRAEPATTITFDPTSKSVKTNDSFSVNVVMDTAVNSVATAEIYITFDAGKLNVIELKPGSFMPHALVEPTFDNNSGTGFIAVDTLSADASPSDVPFTKRSDGPKPVAVITFKAKAETGSTPTTVGFSQQTKAFGETSGTLEPTSLILTSSLANVSKITISAVVTTTPTPTPGIIGTNKPPVCNSLTASPATGSAPLTVTLTANASDQDNDILSALFTFGDGQTQTVDKNIGQTGSIQVSHVYQNVGSASTQAIVRDRDGAVSTACANTITVAAGTITPGVGGAVTPTPTPLAAGSTATPTAVPTIPVTGDITPTTLLTIAGAALVVIGAILFFAL